MTNWVLGGWAVGGGGVRDDSADILFQSFLREAVVSGSGMGGDVHSWTLSIQRVSLTTTSGVSARQGQKAHRRVSL